MNLNRLRRKQKGASVIFILIILVLIGLGAYAGIQYIPQQIESSTVDSMLESIQQSHRKEPAQDIYSVQSAIDKQLNINVMNDLKDSFDVTQNGGEFTIKVNYDREIDLLFTKKKLHYEKSITLN
jgi:hypothetical protein